MEWSHASLDYVRRCSSRKRAVAGPPSSQPSVNSEPSEVQCDSQGTPPSVDNLFSADPYANRFLYTGREFLKEANLYDYRNRVYSSDLGRFLQPDSIRFDAGDVNLYRYVSNNPVNYVDPLGLCRNKGESFYDCLDRHARDFYGGALDWSDNLGFYGLGAAATAAGTSLLSAVAEAAADSAIKNAPLAGVREGGSMARRMAAAGKAARSAGRLSVGKAALGFLSKASAVVGVGATAFSAGARAAFIGECSEECCE